MSEHRQKFSVANQMGLICIVGVYSAAEGQSAAKSGIVAADPGDTG